MGCMKIGKSNVKYSKMNLAPTFMQKVKKKSSHVCPTGKGLSSHTFSSIISTVVYVPSTQTQKQYLLHNHAGYIKSHFSKKLGVFSKNAKL